MKTEPGQSLIEALRIGQRGVLRRLHDDAKRAETSRASPRGRLRNKPCPCGSGRKAKRCCFASKRNG